MQTLKTETTPSKATEKINFFVKSSGLEIRSSSIAPVDQHRLLEV